MTDAKGARPVPSREAVQALAGGEGVVNQRAGRLAAEQHLVARLDKLEFRGQRAVGNLDREELQFLVPARAGDRIGAQERFAVRALQTDHSTNSPERNRKVGGRVIRNANMRSV